MSPTDDQADASNGPNDQDARVDRLADAMDAFLEFKGGGDGPAADFLERHAPLRDLLEPMVGVDDGSVDSTAGGQRLAGEVVQPGHILGDYRILREVGRGGMGTVFEAEQVSLRRRIALKLLHEHLTWSPKAIERFRREAAAASGLHHPGIVPIHEVGEWRGRHYFTMEFLEGRPLHEAMRQPRLGIRDDCSRAAEAAELVARVGDALQHAHDSGLIHRDVKPHNIMVGNDGSVRLLDFGLVKNVDLAPDSVTEGFLGTPHYCSPEQAVGESIGPRSDVFSLGVVLYELLAGRRPFAGDSAREVLEKIETADFEPLRRTAPNAPRDLRTICEKAMECAPGDRYASAGDMAADLRRFLRIEPILATPPGTLMRCGKWLRRHRVGFALSTTASLLVIGAPIAYAVHEYRTRVAVERERRQLDEAERVAFRGISETLTMLNETLSRQSGPSSRKQPHVDRVVRLCEQYLDIRVPDPDRTLRVAEAYRAIASIDLQLDDFEAALTACRRGMQLVEEARAGTDPAKCDWLQGSLLRQELLIRQFLDPGGGGAEFATAIEHWRPLARDPEAAPETALEYAETLIARARALADLKRHVREAEPLVREALAVLTPERRAALPRAEAMSIRAANTLGHVLTRSGRMAEAVPELEQLLARIAELPRNEFLGAEQVLATATIGEAWRRLGKRKEAIEHLRRAVDTAGGLLTEYAGSLQLRRAQQRARVSLAGLILPSNAAEAEEILRAASVAAAIDALPSARTNSIDRALRVKIDVQLANAITMRSRGTNIEEPRQLFLSSCAELERLATEQPERIEFRMEIGGVYNNLAAFANESGEHEAARDFAERAIRSQQQVLAAAPENAQSRLFLGMHYSQLALALANLGDADDAVAAAIACNKHVSDNAGTLRIAATAATIAFDSGANDDHAAVAIRLLTRIAGFDAAEARRLVGHQRFAPLRGRPDFTELERRVR
ncbi:MAG: serine/threonine protein kinase [Planctomycetes bacterium]|nr:serine/threonine protein kinase [Planctomycetota bacterium]